MNWLEKQWSLWFHGGEIPSDDTAGEGGLKHHCVKLEVKFKTLNLKLNQEPVGQEDQPGHWRHLADS